jgi:hypothetical protein
MRNGINLLSCSPNLVTKKAAASTVDANVNDYLKVKMHLLKTIQWWAAAANVLLATLMQQILQLMRNWKEYIDIADDAKEHEHNADNSGKIHQREQILPFEQRHEWYDKKLWEPKNYIKTIVQCTIR